MCGDGRLVDMKAYVSGRLGGIEAGACGAGLRHRACGAGLRRLPAPAGACRRLCGPPSPMRLSVTAIISPHRVDTLYILCMNLDVPNLVVRTSVYGRSYPRKGTM